MDWPELVDRLAAHAGIEPSYYDIHGARHETSLGTKLLVLSALGFDVSSPSTVAHAIADLDAAPWAEPASKVVFCAADRASAHVDIVAPADSVSDTWRWRLELESKSERAGEFRPQDLPLVDARTIEGVSFERRRLVIGAPVPDGYHRLTLEARKFSESTLIAVPDTCFLPPRLAAGDRLWGVSTHLYSLRSERDWGIGDFGDLRRLLRLAGESGASFVAVNPFHAPLSTRPDHASPYSPSSRLFLNPLYIEIADRLAPDTVASLRGEPLVDYPGVAAAKRNALQALWAEFDRKRRQPQSAIGRAFAQFVHDGGVSLRHFATFCALAEVLKAGSWRQWPAHFRHPGDPAVASFARENEALIGFHQFEQFLAERQLDDAQQTAGGAGMDIGIVRDLALGVDPDGADAWMGQDALADRLRCGAPRDAFHPTGQEWGVLPFNPLALRRDWTPFVRLLRANMRHAGGLRMDHIIGIERQFLVPTGEPPTMGCYVRYPREELMGLIALESRRNRCMVIGEDLGTVPEGFRERMDAARMFGCSILPFEKVERGRFRAPKDYRKHSMASAGTHDLPTLRGYWSAADIETRERLGLQGADASERVRVQRAEEKRALLEALGGPWAANAGGEPSAEQLRRAVHDFLAASAAQLFAAQLDDLLDEGSQLNVPGTVDAYPNWRRKLSAALEEPTLKNALIEFALAARRAGRV